MNRQYYIYALKDPRVSPAAAFYIGKGTGTRAYDHLARVDETRKGERIRDILNSGHEVLVTMLAEDLTEPQALKLEAELISAFGTEATGGALLNTIVPSGRISRPRSNLVIPSGVQEKAQIGPRLLKDAVIELAKANSGGITNADTSKALGLQSDYGGGSKDYLAYSILGLLMRDGKLARDERKGRGRHVSQIR